ncbi:hypothetical protein VCHA52P453_50178 [Vibrio chagasii]|nr:hypothetical protein VCHA49P381_130091 [Vibrio chagasii]CAH7332649.1 hypothetical protein VCHA39P226_50042 [Vibrio chagasii]CAH7372098.1 hypothetical protein VCHA52P453_50178 [Vibrio chagasii]CAH7392680.1 hypothetical protein VCHA52P456_70041 [Vibrio chagasii]
MSLNQVIFQSYMTLFLQFNAEIYRFVIRIIMLLVVCPTLTVRDSVN